MADSRLSTFNLQPSPPSTLCIVGLGLMGGSLALALRPDVERSKVPAFNVGRIIGVSRSAETLHAALTSGALDAGTTELTEGVATADVIVLATPVRTILRLLPEIGRHARPGALVMDMGSSKAQICAAMADLPDRLQPVGAHPMCGKEIAGFAAAEAGLYRDRPFVLCPLERTAPEALATARSLALAVGGRPIVVDPRAHDCAVAAISHLPYAVAATLVRTVDTSGDELAWALASSGFRDTTRVAASDVDMMLDTLLTNRAAMLDRLDAFADQLAILRDALAEGDEDGLRTRLAAAQVRRAGMRI
jgi:prephenate dehydrogenase